MPFFPSFISSPYFKDKVPSAGQVLYLLVVRCQIQRSPIFVKLKCKAWQNLNLRPDNKTNNNTVYSTSETVLWQMDIVELKWCRLSSLLNIKHSQAWSCLQAYLFQFHFIFLWDTPWDLVTVCDKGARKRLRTATEPSNMLDVLYPET